MSEVVSSLSIGQVAERTGLSVHTLRFYESEGMLANEVLRGANGRRIYTEDDVEWLGICSSFRASGMPLTTIRRYAELVRQGTGNEADRLGLLRHHESAVNAQIAALTQCLEVIRYKVKIYEDHLADGTADKLWTGSAPYGD